MTKVLTEILKSVTKKLKNSIKSEEWVSYSTFKTRLIEDEVYISDPSIRAAWIRVKGSEYCLGSTGENNADPTKRKILLDLGLIRHDLAVDITEVEQKKKKNNFSAEAY